MSIVVRTCLIAFPQIMLLSIPANALPVEVGRVADIYANAIVYQDAKPAPEIALQPIEIPEIAGIAPIVPPLSNQNVPTFAEVVADTVDRGAPVLADATVEDIAPAILTEAVSAPVIEDAVVDVSSQRPRPCLLYTSPSPRDKRQFRMPSSA